MLRNERIYDSVKGLTSQSKFYSPNTSTNGWQLNRTEEFGYDANLDYLTSAEYGDSLTNHAVTWTYDAAGNRATDSSQTGTWTYDNLNRMTSANGTTCTYDILGNQLTKGSSRTVTYDALNRMTSHVKSTGSNAYSYRADGMRVHKEFTTPSPLTMPYSTDFFYDGQMGFEDDEIHASGGNVYVNRYGLGARGIDFQETTTNPGGSQTVAATYPLYDGHGNMIATIAKSGSSFTLGNQRAFDAWGGIRQGATSGNPRGRYCANIGHIVDDESGLIYMRARYYEPGAGRFISEDKANDGSNWLIYCKNNPVSFSDESGNSITNSSIFEIFGSLGHALMLSTFALSWCAGSCSVSPTTKMQLLVAAAATMTLAVASYSIALGGGTSYGASGNEKLIILARPFCSAVLGLIPAFVAGLSESWRAGLATVAIVALSTQTAVLMGELFAQELEGV